MKRIIAILLAALMLLSMVACGGEDPTTTTTTKKTTTTTTRRTEDPGNTIEPEPGDDPEKYDANVYLAYGSPVVDGVKEDCWSKAMPVTLETIMKDAPEATVTAYQLWDENRLYFFFEIEDADVAQDSTEGDWHNDGIYLYISELCTFGVSSYDSYVDYEGLYQFAIINETLTQLPRYGAADFTEDDYTCNINITENGITIEFSYAPKYLKLEAGQQICLDYQYNDCTTEGVRIGCLSWWRTRDGDTDPVNMAVGELLAEGAEMPTIE